MHSRSRVTAFLLSAVLVLSLLIGCVSDTKEQTPPGPTQATSVSPATEIVSAGAQGEQKTASLTVGGNLKVHLLDVGQGDAIFIELPTKPVKTMLIDAGDSQSGDVVTKYISDKKYKNIDYLVATHPHEDHIGGMVDVIDSFSVGAVYMPDALHTTKTFESFLDAILDNDIGATKAMAGVKIIDTNYLKIEIVAPVNTEYEDLNNYSAVIKLTYKSKSFLFTGDAEELSESEITADINADVLKVGHHGSNSSSSKAFLDKVSPTFSVISCGKDNSYKHPHSEVVKRLETYGKVYRTDIDGTIVITTDGKALTQKNIATSPIQPNAPPSSATKNATNSSVTTSKQETKDITVYVTKTGEKYHSGGCQYLKKSKIAIPLSKAKKNYSPCSKCNPPK